MISSEVHIQAIKTTAQNTSLKMRPLGTHYNCAQLCTAANMIASRHGRTGDQIWERGRISATTKCKYSALRCFIGIIKLPGLGWAFIVADKCNAICWRESRSQPTSYPFHQTHCNYVKESNVSSVKTSITTMKLVTLIETSQQTNVVNLFVDACTKMLFTNYTPPHPRDLWTWQLRETRNPKRFYKRLSCQRTIHQKR